MKNTITSKLASLARKGASILASAAVMVGMLQAARVVADPSCGLSKSGTAEVGKTISINVGVSGDGPYGGYDGRISYDSDFFSLEGISAGGYGAANFSHSGSVFLDYNCNIPSGATIVSIQLKCLKEGSTSISVSLEVSSLDGLASYSTGSSANIDITAPVVLSGNNYLSSLSVAPGTLSPSFSKDTTSYHVTVSDSQSSIAVSASAEHPKASVSTNGVQNKLSKGDNTVKITVTAENGDTRTYKIRVTRGAPTPTPEPYPVIVSNGESYTILEPKSLENVPAGFTWSKTTYNSKNVPCMVGPDGTLLMWLLSDSGNGLYRYDLTSQTVTPCFACQTEARQMMFMSFPEGFVCPTGFEATTFKYNEIDVPAYQNKQAEGQPLLVYILDEEGHEGIYYLDEETRMIIPFRGDMAALIATPTPTPTPSPTPTPTPTPTNSPTPTPTEAPKTLFGGSFYKVSTFILGGLSVILLIALVVLLILRSKEKADRLDEELDTPTDTTSEEQKEENEKSSETEETSDHYYQFGDEEEAPRRPGARRAGEDLDHGPAPDFPEFPEKKQDVPVKPTAPTTILNVVDDTPAEEENDNEQDSEKRSEGELPDKLEEGETPEKLEEGEIPEKLEEGEVLGKLESGMTDEGDVAEDADAADDKTDDESDTEEDSNDDSDDAPTDDSDDAPTDDPDNE